MMSASLSIEVAVASLFFPDPGRNIASIFGLSCRHVIFLCFVSRVYGKSKFSEVKLD